MSHFAKIVDGKVVSVIVAEPEFFDTGGQHPENRPLRKNYAGVGYSYDAVKDAFIPPQPFASWVLDDDTCLWNAPVVMPTDGKPYAWDEATTSWKEVVPA